MRWWWGPVCPTLTHQLKKCRMCFLLHSTLPLKSNGFSLITNRIGGVMVSVLASSVVDRPKHHSGVVLVVIVWVGFTTTYAISTYHHKRCEFKSRSCEVCSIQHYVIKFVSDLRQVGGFLRFKLTTFVVIGTDCIGSCKSNPYDHDQDDPRVVLWSKHFN
jgi:hypothetical protein